MGTPWARCSSRSRAWRSLILGCCGRIFLGPTRSNEFYRNRLATIDDLTVVRLKQAKLAEARKVRGYSAPEIDRDGLGSRGQQDLIQTTPINCPNDGCHRSLHIIEVHDHPGLAVWVAGDNYLQPIRVTM